ncbi:class I SAM-dependent methyltransferase [Candidatus Woesebacteria bacterium]|nr:class I SAM-dependent methyltransferase [Candidatus Woesebacteria bacterium]
MRSPAGISLLNSTEYALEKYTDGGDFLDAGAGKLAYRSLLQEHGDTYTSSDFQKVHKDLDVVTDIEKMSFKSKKFDVVFCSQVLEHVPHPWHAMGEIYRVLKPSGTAIITVPMLGYIHNAPYDFYRYTRYGLQMLAEDAGFTVLEITPIGGFFAFLGYVFATVISPLYGIPVIGKLLVPLLYPLYWVLLQLDRMTKNESLFPLNYLLVVKK